MQFSPGIKNLEFRAFEMLEKIGVSSKPRRCAKPPGTDVKPTEFDGNRHQAIEEAESAFWMLPDALAPKCFPLGSQNRRHVRSSRHVLIEGKSKSNAGGLHLLLIIMWSDTYSRCSASTASTELIVYCFSLLLCGMWRSRASPCLHLASIFPARRSRRLTLPAS
jgi:hypothetical protein